MTRRYLALLRGVNNIGRARRVAMADLRARFERLGFREVRTLLNSGNVIFSTTRAGRTVVEARIAKGLAQLAPGVALTVLTSREVVAVVRDNPLAGVATNPSRLLVMVPRRRADLKLLGRLAGVQPSREVLAIQGRVAYLWCAHGVPRSPLWGAVDRALDRTGTVRNIATFARAAALLGAPPLEAGRPRRGGRSGYTPAPRRRQGT